MAVAAFGGGAHFSARDDAVFGEAGFGRNETNRTAFGTGAEQRALRATQDFHTLQIEQLWIGIRGTETVWTDLHRRVVDINTNRRGACAGGNAANRDGVRLRI